MIQLSKLWSDAPLPQPPVYHGVVRVTLQRAHPTRGQAANCERKLRGWRACTNLTSSHTSPYFVTTGHWHTNSCECQRRMPIHSEDFHSPPARMCAKSCSTRGSWARCHQCASVARRRARLSPRRSPVQVPEKSFFLCPILLRDPSLRRRPVGKRQELSHARSLELAPKPALRGATPAQPPKTICAAV